MTNVDTREMEMSELNKMDIRNWTTTHKKHIWRQLAIHTIKKKWYENKKKLDKNIENHVKLYSTNIKLKKNKNKNLVWLPLAAITALMREGIDINSGNQKFIHYQKLGSAPWLWKNFW